MKRYIKSAVKTLQDLNRDQKIYIARHSPLSGRDLKSLASDNNEYVRMGVARNPLVSLDVLEQLVGDAYSINVSDAAISNKSVTPEVLISWVDNSKPIVRWRIAGSKKTPIEVLRYIVDNCQDERAKHYAEEELQFREGVK